MPWLHKDEIKMEGWGFMNSHRVKLKNTNMLCNKCVIHVLKALTGIQQVNELVVDLNKRLVKIVYDDEDITKEMVTRLVKNAIEGTRPGNPSMVNSDT